MHIRQISCSHITLCPYCVTNYYIAYNIIRTYVYSVGKANWLLKEVISSFLMKTTITTTVLLLSRLSDMTAGQLPAAVVV